MMYWVWSPECPDPEVLSNLKLGWWRPGWHRSG